MVNYYNKSLIRELAGRGYDVTAVTHISQLAKRGYGVSISSRNDNRVASESFINKFDLIYFAKIYPPVWDDIELLFRRNKIPIIYAFHFPALNNHPYRLKNHIFNLISIAKILNIKIAGHIPGLHVLNSNDYQVLTSLGLKCYSVPLGVDAEQFRQGVKNDAFTVVFSAIDSTYAKGVDMLTKILPELIRKAPGLTILFIGGLSSPRLTSLKSLFKENIDVVAFLPQEQFAKHLGSSHVLLFPSRFEAFGLTALAALR